MKDAIKAIVLALKIWSFMQLRQVFKRQNEINSEIVSLSVGAGDAELLQIEILHQERKCNTQFISSVQPYINDKP